MSDDSFILCYLVKQSFANIMCFVSEGLSTSYVLPLVRETFRFEGWSEANSLTLISSETCSAAGEIVRDRPKWCHLTWSKKHLIQLYQLWWSPYWGKPTHRTQGFAYLVSKTCLLVHLIAIMKTISTVQFNLSLFHENSNNVLEKVYLF